MAIKASSIPILGLLTLRPMSGYELKKTIDISLNYFWSESFGQLYPQLKNLRDAKMIELLPISDATVREKKVYKITKLGEAALASWISGNPVIRPPRDELLLKIFFAPEGDTQAVRGHCIKSRVDAMELLKRYEAIDAQLATEVEHKQRARYWRMTLRLGISQTRNYIDWCDEVIDELKTEEETK